MYNNHFYIDGNQVCILLKPKNGKQRNRVGDGEEDVIVKGGVFLELISQVEDQPQPSQYKLYIFRSCNERHICYVSCGTEDVSFLDREIYLLLLPIPSKSERLLILQSSERLKLGKSLLQGDQVFVILKDWSTEIEGLLRYKGPIDDSKGTYFGVELKENKGLCDGEWNGTRYFNTARNHAIFVPLHRIHKSRKDCQENNLRRAADLSNSGIHMDGKTSSVSHNSCTLQSMPEYKGIKLGGRVVWPTDHLYEKGTVKWIGCLPGGPEVEDVTFGVEFDNPVGTGTGKYHDHRLFYAKQGHASLVPPMGLLNDNSNWVSNEHAATGHQTSKLDVQDRWSQTTQYAGATAAEGEMRGRSTRQNLDPTLNIDSLVEIQWRPPLYGVIRWIGSPEGKMMAGVELEEEHSIGSDGTYRKHRYFQCSPKKACFVPLSKLVRDRRFSAKPFPPRGLSSVTSPDVEGDVPIPEIPYKDLHLVCGRSKGIQGHHNSCYLDATLFCMFYFSTVFDYIFNRPPKEDDLPEYQRVQQVLKEGIVNPLRKHHYVSSGNVWKLRQLLDELGTVPGMLGEEKDVEEFFNALLSQIMKADPLLHLSTGADAYFYQLFMEKDKNLLLPTTQKLVELSFLQESVKLKEVPACLMVQMPRFGKDYKMFRRIVPSLQLDITDILENSPRDCIVCGDLAMWECKQCYQVHGMGLNTTAFCERCSLKSHQHNSRKDHKPVPISTELYLSHFQKLKVEEMERQRQKGDEAKDYGDIKLRLPREKMELFAIICIQTSHYVSFVKCGPGIDAPWVFFDSMADRIGEQAGYNVPEVVHVPDMKSWLSEDNFNQLLKEDRDKELPEHLRRLLCDGYMCMYQSPDVMMYQ